MIAWLGTGMLGAGFARHLVELGETVRAWNRSPERSQPLAADGVAVCTTAAEAIRGADQIHLTLADDASVDAVLEPLASHIGPATTIIDHTTTAPTPTAERVARWKARGVTFVHAPVFMGPPQARDGGGLMLVSGPPEHYAAVKPTLERMTGKVLEYGGGFERAAAFKLFGNLAIVANICAMADIFELAKSVGIAAPEARELFDVFNVGAQYTVRGKRMAAGETKPVAWELDMARKDVRLMLEEAQRHGSQLPLIATVATIFDEAIAEGKGKEDVGVVAVAHVK